jgi:hypothetical protein
VSIPEGGLNVRAQRASSPPKLQVQPLDTTTSIRNMAYERLKKAITEMDIYDHPEEIRLDERQLSEDLAVSRTPVLARLRSGRTIAPSVRSSIT